MKKLTLRSFSRLGIFFLLFFPKNVAATTLESPVSSKEEKTCMIAPNGAIKLNNKGDKLFSMELALCMRALTDDKRNITGPAYPQKVCEVLWDLGDKLAEKIGFKPVTKQSSEGVTYLTFDKSEKEGQENGTVTVDLNFVFGDAIEAYDRVENCYKELFKNDKESSFLQTLRQAKQCKRVEREYLIYAQTFMDLKHALNNKFKVFKKEKSILFKGKHPVKTFGFSTDINDYVAGEKDTGHSLLSKLFLLTEDGDEHTYTEKINEKPKCIILMVANKYQKHCFVLTINYGEDEKERVEELLEDEDYEPISFRDISRRNEVKILAQIPVLNQTAEISLKETFQGVFVNEKPITQVFIGASKQLDESGGSSKTYASMIIDKGGNDTRKVLSYVIDQPFFLYGGRYDIRADHRFIPYHATFINSSTYLEKS